MKPLLRGHFHQAMFFITLGAGVPLVITSKAFSIGIYILCALTLFCISSLYHRINWGPKKRLVWKKLDHCCIYLMIAGTFTPIAIMGLPEEASFQLLATIWTVVILGIVQSLFFVNIPKIFSSLIYLVAGYLILPYLPQLKESLGTFNVTLLILGGVFYSLGALSYGLKRPILNPSIFSYHEVFHIMVNLGAITHFILISSLVS